MVFRPNGLLDTSFSSAFRQQAVANPPSALAAACSNLRPQGRPDSLCHGKSGDTPRAVQGRSPLMELRRPRHTMLDQAVPSDRAPKVYDRGRRRCAGCRAFLSRYNPNDFCWPCKPEGRRIVTRHSRDEANRKLDFAELMEDVA